MRIPRKMSISGMTSFDSFLAPNLADTLESPSKAIDGDFCPVTHDLVYGGGLGRDPDLSHGKRLYWRED